MNNNETTADIIAEMETERPGLMNAKINTNNSHYARRLKVAHRRERGDAAKLREAVIEARRFVFAALRGQHYILVNDGTNEPYVIRPKVTLTKIDAALSAPPRNCDRFATIDEARKAHEAICEKYGKCHNGCPLNNEEHYSAFDCFEAWLFAQAEGGAK